ncbi:MAG: response regulator [Nitrospirae bacterium]|nr:response regulator [Nitrospirota bacterium]
MKHKVLLVEDDKMTVKALSVRLKAKGYEVIVAFDAVMALAKAKEHRPDVVLLDIFLPGGNGLTVAEWLQDSTFTTGTPLIFLTASQQPELREKAMALGAAAFFEKPFEFSDLLAAIQEAIGVSSQQPVSIS